MQVIIVLCTVLVGFTEINDNINSLITFFLTPGVYQGVDL